MLIWYAIKAPILEGTFIVTYPSYLFLFPDVVTFFSILTTSNGSPLKSRLPLNWDDRSAFTTGGGEDD